MAVINKLADIRSYCLLGDAKITVSSNRGQFTYRIQASNKNIWWVKGLAERPIHALSSRHDETRGEGKRFRYIGRIGPTFQFKLGNESRFSGVSPIVQTFVNFHKLVFKDKASCLDGCRVETAPNEKKATIFVTLPPSLRSVWLLDPLSRRNTVGTCPTRTVH